MHFKYSKVYSYILFIIMIPDYQSIMLPLLTFVSKSNWEVAFRDIINNLSDEFHLTIEERSEFLPSQTQPIFDNRVWWAKTYLKKAWLIEVPRRAVVTITQRWKEIIKSNPPSINVKFLKQFPEFLEFQTPKKKENVVIDSNDDILEQTPEEILDSAYQKIRKSLAQDIISKVMLLSPAFFERLVIELLVKMGYWWSMQDAGKAIWKTGDEWIDWTIKEDKLGLDIIYIQAKRWQPGNTVWRPEIQKFVWALAGQGAKKWIFITTSSFTRDALEYVPRNETKIVLIDWEYLAQLMIDYNLWVSIIWNYEVKRIDSDYFWDE